MGLGDFLKDYTPIGMMVGDSPERPAYPEFQMPEWAQGLPEEVLGLIRGGVGAQVGTPPEWGMASGALERLLGLQPEQFQFPMEEIQQAMQAQQGLQMQDWQKQIRPMLAQQGQLDSSYYTNLMSDMMRGQQAQTYGTTADLLTQQAQQNLALQQYFPQMQAGVAGQLAGIGGQRAGLDLQNIQLPFQTTIPALQGAWTGMGMPLAQQQFQQQLGAQQQEMGVYNQAKQSYDQTRAQLWNMGINAATGGIGGLFGGAGGGGAVAPSWQSGGMMGGPTRLPAGGGGSLGGYGGGGSVWGQNLGY